MKVSEHSLLINQHEKSVKAIASQVRSFFDKGKPFRVYHGSTNSTRSQAFTRDAMVDVSALNRVLTLDAEAMVAVVEPNVPMDALVKATLAYGLMPPVVMEFPGITVGGGLQGGAGESSSYRWGCFSRTLDWYEMVLGDGSVVTASPQENADLYHGSAGAYGSLGVVTAAQVKLVKAAKYVALEYRLVRNFDEMMTATNEATAGDYEFVDGIMFARDLGVVICGRLSDAPVGAVRQCRRATDDWFYLQVETAARSGRIEPNSYSLEDYLFRYDRGAFWTGKYAFKRFGVPFNRLTRWILNPLMATRKMYLALNASGFDQQYIVQDLAMPAETAAAFMDWTDRETGIYPLWVCPLLVERDSRLLGNHLPVETVINVGVWGPGPEDHEQFVAANRALEEKVRELGGRKWLYAHAYYPEDEFWDIYDRNWYDALRQKYHATSLPSVYEKTHVKAGQLRPISGKSGVWRAIVGSKRPS